MNRTLAVGSALAGALGLGLWLWSGMSGSRAPVPQALEAEAARASDAPGAPGAPAPPELASAPALQPAPAPAAEVEPKTAPAPPDERTPLADIAERWVEGVVLFPEGTPADEQARVVLNAPQHSVPVGPDGRFRLAVGAKQRTVRLGLEARYLRLAEEASYPVDELVTLRTRLGGRIEGRVIVPNGGTAQGGVVERHSDSDDDSYGQIELGADPVFAFDALEAGSRCDLSYLGPTLIGQADGIRIEAGRTQAVELVLSPGVVLAGTVRDEAGQPLAGAYVSAHSDPRQKGPYYSGDESADDGSFHLDAIRPGEVVVEVSLEGFLTRKLELGALEGGAKREDLALVLDRGQAIAGRVLWPDGSPAARAWVEIENEVLWGGRDPILELTEGGDQKADSEGRFRLTGMGEGPYRVSAKATRREEKTVTSVLTGRPRQKTEHTTLFAEAEHVAPGTEDLTLTLSEGLEVRGRVVDDRGLPLEEFSVRADRVRSREVAPSELVDGFHASDGAFELSGLLPGEWEFTAWRRGDRMRSEPVRVSLPTAESIELVLPRPANVSGVVLAPHGAPAANARVLLESDDDPSTSRADERGAFTLTGLRPGPVALSAQGVDDAPGERLELELAPGEERTGLVLHLRAGATITGEVVDGAGRPEVDQSVFARDDSGARVRTKTDAEGRFVLAGLAEGEVELIAETVEGVVLRRSIALGASETVHVRLALEERALVRLTGRITAGGEALEDALFHAYGRGDTGDSQGEVDETGAYEVLLPGPGTYSLYVHGSGARSLSYEEVLVVPGVSELTHDVLIPVGRISGRVTDTQGRPLAAIDVGSEPGRHEAGEGFGTGRTWTDAEGRYELVLPPGRHSLRAGGVAKRGVGYAEKRVEGLVLAADAHLRDVDFMLSEGGGIRGRLRGSAGDTELWSFEAAAPRPLGYADDDGSFSIGGLAPGPYLIGAVGERAATREPVPVEVEAGATRELVLELVPATQVHVRARDASGAPLGCEIRASAADGRPCPQRTGTLGEAWIGALLPGRYAVRATREGRTVERAIELTGPSEDPLEIVLVFE